MKDLVEVLKDDRGCKLWNKCTECPYDNGTIEFKAKCILDYANGERGLVSEIRSSVLYSLFVKGVSVTILARVFNVSTRAVREAIYRYVRSKE